MANAKKLYYVFNFIQKGGFGSDVKSFPEAWIKTTHFIRDNYSDYVCTQLHRNLDPKGAFPHINHAAFDGLSFDGLNTKGPPSAKWLKQLKDSMGDGGGSGNETIAFPGGYHEISTTSDGKLAPWLPKDDKSLFILTAFKVNNERDAQMQENFEKNWKEASGVNFILKNAPKELGIKYSALYKKFTPRPGLLYVLRTELADVGETSEAAKTFLAQLKAFSFPKYFDRVDVDLFYPDAENIIFSAEGQRDLPEGFSYKPTY